MKRVGTQTIQRLQMESKLKELFVLSMDGDQEAYESFLEIVSVIVKRDLFFLQKGKYQSELMEDLHQEIMLSIHQKKHTYQLDRPILPWIHAVTKHRFIDFYRSVKRHPPQIEFYEEYQSEQESATAIDLAEIMDSLSPKQKELLVMVKVEGASYSEAAEALDMSLASVKVGIHRMIKSMKQRILK